MTQPLQSLLIGVLIGAGLARTARSVARRLVPAQPRVGPNAPTGTSRRTRVSVVDDPDGTMRLIAVDGPIGPEPMRAIQTAMSGAGSGASLHLDLTGVSAWPEETLAVLEDVLDDMEMNGVHLRVIGIDPRLPALPRSRAS